MKNKLLLITLICLSSCGLRLTKEVDENLLLGRWEVEYVKCYKTTAEPEELESYRVTGFVESEIEFVDNTINYSAKGETCTTSATGVSDVTFSAKNIGILKIVNPVIGGKCAESVIDSRSTQAHSVDFDMSSNKVRSLSWKILDGNFLIIDILSDFKGSNLSDFCSKNCHCRLELKKF